MKKGFGFRQNPFDFPGGAEGDRTPDLKTASMKQQKKHNPLISVWLSGFDLKIKGLIVAP